MTLTAQEQELFDFAVGALPRWFTSDERQREELYAMAKVHGAAQVTSRYWFRQTLITQAEGPTSTTPDWLNQHAIDRGTRRQSGESDPALQNRLRNVPDALTRTSLLAATNAILAAEGLPQTAAMVELPRDAAHFGTYAPMTGTGGTLSTPDGGGFQTFTPAMLPWPTPPLDGSLEGWDWTLTITGATNATNDVAAVPILSLVGDGARFSNPTGLGETSALTWTAHKLRWHTVTADGFGRAYFGRGYRMAPSRPLGLILILPYGATAGTERSVFEMLRQKKAAGYFARVERRLVP